MDGQIMDDQYYIGDGIVMYRKISSNDNKVFAAISGDDSPVHFDANRMANTHFKRPIMNGIHTMSLIGATIVTAYTTEKLMPVVTEQHNSFIAPVYAEQPLEISVKIDEVIGPNKYWVQAIVKDQESNEPLVSARLKMRMIQG